MLRDLRIAKGLGISLRRFLGWEPETRVVSDGDGWLLVREPEFDKEQYELMVALHEHEGSLNSLGIPMDEAMSPLADPDNPNAAYGYVAKPYRDHAEQAAYEAQKLEKWSGDNYTPARKWRVERVGLKN